MEQTTLTSNEIEYLVKVQENTSKIFKIFFLFWKCIGIVGVIGCIYSMGIEFLNAQTSYEKFIMIFSMILGVLMVSGFFLGIPILIEKSFKKKINKIRNREFKVYVSNVIDKKRFRHDKKTTYRLYFQNGNQKISATISSRGFDSLNIGDEALIIDFGQGISNLEAYNRKLMYI